MYVLSLFSARCSPTRTFTSSDTVLDVSSTYLLHTWDNSLFLSAIWVTEQASACHHLWISLSTGHQVLCAAFLLRGKLRWDVKPALRIWIYSSLDRPDFCLGRVQLNCCGLKCSWNKSKGSDAMLPWSLTGVGSVLSQPSVSTCPGPSAISPQTLQSGTSLGKWVWQI